MTRSIKLKNIFRKLTFFVFLSGALMAFAFIGGQGLWVSADVQIAKSDDPLNNNLDIFETEGVNVGSQIQADTNPEDETVTVLKNWKYTDRRGCFRR